jgi:outer membrane protein assembly factor BamB
MAIAQTVEPTLRKPLRVWPGVVAVVLLWLVRFGLKLVLPGFKGFAYGMMGGLVCALLVLLWWLFFSRAPWSERLGALALMIVALGTAWRFKDPSMNPVWLIGYAVPVLLLAFVAWAVAARRLPSAPRRATMAATLLLAGGAWLLVRTGGIDGDHNSEFAWRWAATPEQRLLDQAGEKPPALPAAPPPAESPEEPAAAQAVDEPAAVPEVPAAVEAVEVSADWPGFRGPDRNGVVGGGVRIETDWSQSPPVELWRRPVGPGWSSFAVRGDLVYTQEQRGEDEVVACYKVNTGEPVWEHHDATRFFESNAGAGPRGTPTLSEGRVYTFGATGIVNVLDAGSGAVVWSRNAASDADAKVPDWGFSSSPLVVGDVVLVAADGKLVAYDRATGDPRWFGPAAGETYSSPHLLTIDGVVQVLQQNHAGATSFVPADGAVLWEHPWPGFPIVQPAQIANGDVLLSGQSGTGRLAVAHEPGGWTVEERWTSIGLKPYFNDFVVHEGHAYGFDGRYLASLDLQDGKRKWKGGRYGNGQLVLLPDQDLLLVLSDKGELALVKATPDQFTELARLKAIEGKTWNHPVLAGEILLVRNDQEMAAFRVARAGR